MAGQETTLTEWQVRDKIEANDGLFAIVQLTRLLNESSGDGDLEFIWDKYGPALVTAVHHVAQLIYAGPMSISRIEEEGGIQFCRAMGYDEEKFRRDQQEAERKKAMDLMWLQLSESQQEDLVSRCRHIKEAATDAQ